MYTTQDGEPKVGAIIATIAIGIFLFIVLWMSVMPSYRVYKQNKQGEANLRQQEWEKKILIEQANAENESATLKAEARIKQAKAESEAELIRAQGAAEANKVISSSLDEQYLRYRWIEGLHDGNGETIYVPTEGNLPLFKSVE